MSKKSVYLLLATAILLVGGYMLIRFSLKKEIEKGEKETGKSLPVSDTLGGEKISNADLRPLFINRLQLLVAKSSNGLYDLSVGDMKVDILASKLSMEDVMLQPNTRNRDSLKKMGKLPKNVFTISLQSLEINGINLDDAINTKIMDYTLITIENPVIEIHYEKSTEKKNPDLEDFSRRFLKEMEKLSIKNLMISNGTIIAYNDEKKKRTSELNNVEVNMRGIMIDSATRTEKNRFLFAKEATLSFKNYSMPTTGGLYHLKIGGVTVRMPQRQVVLNDLSFSSPFNKKEFAKRQKFSRELYHLILPSVVIDEVSWWELLNQQDLIADNIDVKGGSLSIYLDRSLPPHSKLGNFPNQLLMKLPLEMTVNKLKISDLDFSYEEYNPISGESGTIYIDDVALKGDDISNIRSKKITPVTAKGSGLFMHTVPIRTEFNFDMLHYKSGKFTSLIESDGFDGSVINSFAMPLGLMKIEKGTLQRVEAGISGNESKANGHVLVLYRGLKLSLLEKDKGKETLDRKDFTTFVANNFVLKNSNPQKDEKPRKEKAEFERISEGGFFMLIWKTLMVGTLRTIGAPEKIAYKTVNSQQDE